MGKSKQPQLPLIARNLKRLKTEHLMSQGLLAARAGLAYHTVAKLESGATKDPRLSTLQKIANVFGVTIDKLVS